MGQDDCGRNRGSNIDQIDDGGNLLASDMNRVDMCQDDCREAAKLARAGSALRLQTAIRPCMDRGDTDREKS